MIHRPVVVDAEAVEAWLHEHGIQRIVIISPHLDDAVFSLGGLLGAVAHRCTVLTVFTEADPAGPTEWARMTGFEDPVLEYAARRAEDPRAMAMLGCKWVHGGACVGQLEHTCARQLLDSLVTTEPASRDCLILLPAAAGGLRPHTKLQRIARRLLRQPLGAPLHAEHRLARDVFWRILDPAVMRIGFYAELPYVWMQGDRALWAHLSACFQVELENVRVRSEVDGKLQAARNYRSQVPIVLGKRETYQRKVLGRDESIFLVQESE